MGVILRLEPKKAKNLKRIGERLKAKESKRVSYGGEIKKILQYSIERWGQGIRVEHQNEA